jgi:hypothetical protein
MRVAHSRLPNLDSKPVESAGNERENEASKGRVMGGASKEMTEEGGGGRDRETSGRHLACERSIRID